jgi:hypothetical protein
MIGHELALVGGYWFLFTMAHFFADVGVQDHETAVNKAYNPLTRFFHCAIYTMLMTLMMTTLNLTWGEILVSCLVLFSTHYIGDSYLIVSWWFKHYRDPPWAKGVSPKEMPEAFRRQPITTTLHIEIILFVLVDQLWHILWLGVPAFFAVWEGWL